VGVCTIPPEKNKDTLAITFRGKGHTRYLQQAFRERKDWVFSELPSLDGNAGLGRPCDLDW